MKPTLTNAPAAGSTVTPAGSSGPDPIQTALQLRAQGRLPEALDALSAQHEFSTDFYILRGDLQFALGQWKEAAGSYFTVTASDPGNHYAQRNMGLCLYRLERWEPAAEALQAVLKSDPHRDEVRLELGDCLLHLQRFEEALACLDRCWSESSRRRAVFGRAVALQLLRRFDEAEAGYERLLTLDPRSEEALSNLISLSMEVFDLTRVQKYSNRLLDLNPGSSAALKGLALVAIERRDYAGAAAHFFRAVELEPELIETGPGENCGEEGIENHDAEKHGALEYRIPPKILDALVEARSSRPAKAAHAAGGAR